MRRRGWQKGHRANDKRRRRSISEGIQQRKRTRVDRDEEEESQDIDYDNDDNADDADAGGEMLGYDMNEVFLI